MPCALRHEPLAPLLSSATPRKETCAEHCLQPSGLMENEVSENRENVGSENRWPELKERKSLRSTCNAARLRSTFPLVTQRKPVGTN